MVSFINYKPTNCPLVIVEAYIREHCSLRI